MQHKAINILPGDRIEFRGMRATYTGAVQRTETLASGTKVRIVLTNGQRFIVKHDARITVLWGRSRYRG